jgi:hypothetical protein
VLRLELNPEEAAGLCRSADGLAEHDHEAQALGCELRKNGIGGPQELKSDEKAA